MIEWQATRNIRTYYDKGVKKKNANQETALMAMNE